ncbi:hypothetical protein ANN_18207 [Periplaneta americana]|uniref:Uncharacterized protein n=1 Tax=Periplaneta americana TaxID=6978 RepID=A0ABQ8SPD3_PERAM|nr:hypothetical protein ANN_18207 [Periplaneta americana]
MLDEGLTATRIIPKVMHSKTRRSHVTYYSTIDESHSPIVWKAHHVSNGDIPWPARSPDLSVCDFFLWGHLKNNVYRTRPANIAELKQRIKDEITGIPRDMIQRAFQSIHTRLSECVHRNRAHLSEVIFKK